MTTVIWEGEMKINAFNQYLDTEMRYISSILNSVNDSQFCFLAIIDGFHKLNPEGVVLFQSSSALCGRLRDRTER